MLPAGLLLLLSCLRVAVAQDDSSSSSEEKSGVPIIRQINKVNDDGTYTYGYEAADGSFKIETRDVLGNVKGMFGFIDESGELKRVSYTANNATGYRNSVIHPPVSTTVRPSELLGRRPVLILKNTPTSSSSPTKGPVIQHIPKKVTTKDEDERTSTDGGRQSVRNDSSEERVTSSTEEPTSRPPALNPLRKVLVSKRPVEDKETKGGGGKGGNNLRRQLSRGLDLRGEMSHVYSGGDNRFASAIPPHLSALMSELRPIQVIRAAPPENVVGYQTVDVESASQEINEVPASSTTTELPTYGIRRPFSTAAGAYISPRYRRPVPVPEETQYLQEIAPQYHQPHQQHHHQQHRHHNSLPILPRGYQAAIQPVTPVSAHLPIPEYQTNPHYYDQGVAMIPATLRDELMAIIYNYLQVRLNSLTQPSPYYGRYPYAAATSSPPYLNVPPLYHPTNPTAAGYPYTHGGGGYMPYVGMGGYPYLPLNGYYPPYANPQAVYPVPTQTPYSGPNVQFARPEQQRRFVPAAGGRVQTARAVPAQADDADLLQMLLTSPTRVPLTVQYTPTTTERLVNAKTGQPIRNVQIITDATESTRPGGRTTESSEKK